MKKLVSVNMNTFEYWDNVYSDEIILNKKRIALDRFYKLTTLIKDTSTVVDVGCGKGEFVQYLCQHKKNINCKGVDFSNIAISYCKKILPNCQFFTETVYSLSNVIKEQVDYVTALEILEHLDEPKKFIIEVSKILKKKGWFILTLPYNNQILGEHVYAYNFKDIIDLFQSPTWLIVALIRYYNEFVNMSILVQKRI